MQTGDFSELYDTDRTALQLVRSSSTTDDFGNPCGQLYGRQSSPEWQWNGRFCDANSREHHSQHLLGSCLREDECRGLWGTANRPGILNNIAFTVNNIQRARQLDSRVDWNRTESDHYFFRYSMLRAKLNDLNDINKNNPITGILSSLTTARRTPTV